MSVGEMPGLWQPCLDEVQAIQQIRIAEARANDPLEREERFHDVFSQVFPYAVRGEMSVADSMLAAEEEMSRPTRHVFLQEPSDEDL